MFGCVWVDVVCKSAGAVRTNIPCDDHKACRGETGCISNKPVIVSPTSASSSCYTRPHTHTHKMLSLLPGSKAGTGNDSESKCDNSCTHYSSSSGSVFVALAELQRFFP